jgi:hypothetical protein
MLNKIKYICLGLIIGVTSSFGFTYAQEWLNVSKVKYDIRVNLEPANVGDTAILNYNGATYLPIRKISEITGMKIEWYDKEKLVNIVTPDPKIVQVTKEVPKEVVKEVTKEVVKEVPLAINKVTFDNGNYYEGTFKVNDGFGYGLYRWKNGDYYIGQFKDGLLTGEGTYFASNGNIYIGEFKESNLNGYGVSITDVLTMGKWENGNCVTVLREMGKEKIVPVEKIVYVPISYSNNNDTTSKPNLDEYNNEVKKIKDKYDELKRQATADSELQAKNFAEYLAARGLSKSGTNQQAELNRNMQLQQKNAQYDKQQEEELNNLKIKYGIK